MNYFSVTFCALNLIKFLPLSCQEKIKIGCHQGYKLFLCIENDISISFEPLTMYFCDRKLIFVKGLIFDHSLSGSHLDNLAAQSVVF